MNLLIPNQFQTLVYFLTTILGLWGNAKLSDTFMILGVLSCIRSLVGP